MTRQLLVGDSLTLNGLGQWSTHSGGGSAVTASSGVLTAPYQAKFYFYDSYPVTCIKGGQPATFSALFHFGEPMQPGTGTFPDDFDPDVERVDIIANWLTAGLVLAGPPEASDTYYPGLSDTLVTWDIPAAPATAKYLQLQFDIRGGLGSSFTLYMTNPSLIGLPCSDRVRLRQFPRDDTLGHAPRPGRQSRSTQATDRSGWIGTYR